jgi:flagellar FliJ protein
VAQQERNTATGQMNWQQQRKNLKAIDTLSDRHFSRERTREVKREQKAQDEFAARSKDDEQES